MAARRPHTPDPDEGDVRRSAVVRYAFAAAAVAVAVAVKLALAMAVGREQFLLLFGAVAVASWYGGRLPGLLAAALATAAAGLLFQPHSSPVLSSPWIVQLLVFSTEACALSILVDRVQRARRRAERSVTRLERLHSLSSSLVRARTTSEIADVVARETAAAVGAGSASVSVCTVAADGTLRGAAHVGTDPALCTRIRDSARDPELAAGAAVRTGEIVWVEDEAQIDERPSPAREWPRQPARAKVLFAPVVVGGRTVGLIVLRFAHRRRMGAGELAVIRTVSHDCALALERARLFEAERAARAEAEEASRAKDAFLSVVSHELRTPLTAIVGWAHILRRGIPADAARRDHALDVIVRSAQAQSRLVEDILDMSRIAMGKLRVESRSVDLAAIARRCVEGMDPAAAASGIALDASARDAVPVIGDAHRLEQVVRNLLSNALKFTRPGGHVWVVVEAVDGRATLRVRDDGKGVAAVDLPYVFEAFRQGDSSTTRTSGGLGLGLAIVRHLVAAHGGAVRAESEGPDRGTTVVVELPLGEEAPASTARRPEASVGEKRRTLAGSHVLVVDDDTDALEVAAQVLKDAGAEVRCADSARAALEALRTFPATILVSDIGMAGEDGYWLMRKVRALAGPVAAIPAIALTAYARPEEERAAAAAGFHRYLRKPADPDALELAVASLATLDRPAP